MHMSEIFLCQLVLSLLILYDVLLYAFLMVLTCVMCVVDVDA